MTGTRSFSRLVAFVVAFVAFSATLPFVAGEALALPLGDALGGKVDKGDSSSGRGSEPARARHSDPESARGLDSRSADEAVEPVRRTVDDAVGPARDTAQPVAEMAEPVRKTAEPLAKTVTDTVDPVAKTVKPLTDEAVEPLTRIAAPVLEAVEPAVGTVEPAVGLAGWESEASAPDESVPTTPEPTATPGPEPVVGDEPVRVAESSAIEPVFAAAIVVAEPRFQDAAVQSSEALPLPKPGTALTASRPMVPYPPAPGIEESTTGGTHLSAADSSSRGLGSLFGRAPVVEPLASLGSFATEGALNQVPWPFSPALVTVGSSGVSNSGFGGSIGVGVLALLFALSPPGSRFLGAFRDLPKPNSALRPVLELPG